MASTFNSCEAINSCEQLLFDSEPRKLRAVVVDDSPSYMEVICALLELDDLVDVVGRANDGADAIEAIAHLQPDLLLMDVQMPLLDGLTAASFVSKHFAMTKIVMMSAEDSLQLQAACLASGARAFIHKSKFREQFTHILRAVFDSPHVFDIPAEMVLD